MAKYQQYDKYKDSGVDGLGSIPTQWKISKLAYTFLKANAGEVIDKTYWGSGKEVLYTCNKTPLLSDYIGFPEEKRTTENDLLLTRNGTPYVHKPIEGSIYSNVVQRITLSAEFDRNYLTYCLGNSALSLKGYGVSIESFNFETWKSMQFATPSMKEQKQVVNFLEYETAQIDTLIEKQQTLIQLLKEKRQAVISHAVTKGLNPDAPMKDSGVEWLGDVPEHWNVSRVGYYGQVLNGSTPSKANLSYWYPKEIAWLSSGEVNQYYIESPTDYISYKALKECSVTLLPIGTLVMGMIGQGKTRGMSAVTKIETTINQNLAAVIPNDNLYSNYAHLFFQAAYKELREDARGGNQAALNCEIIRDFKITIPPINEQRTIFIEVNKISDKFDVLMEKAEQAIQLMQERRNALISAAVTGKIDVRGWRAPE